MSMHHQHIRFLSCFITLELLILMCCCNRAITGDASEKTPFCLMIKPDNESVQVSFLTNQLDLSSLCFYWSRWTSEQSVTDCFMSTDVTLIMQYLSLCNRWEHTHNSAELHFNLSLILEDESLCGFKTSPLNSLSLQYVQQMDPSVKRRQKRAFLLLPGTLWCGRGSSANNYEQLGMFENADKCCREHDYCDHLIRAFSVNFGVFNPTLFTISHCDCDHRFKECLLAGNDTISNMVGYSFFNVLKIRCFELSQRKRCTQFNWFGVCTSVQIAPVAVMRDSTPYNSTSLHNESDDITDLSRNEEPIKSSHNNKQSSKSKHMRCHESQKDCVKHTKQDAFQLSHKLKKVKKYEKKKKFKTAEPQKRRKSLLSNSPATFTPSPQPYTSNLKPRTKLKSVHQIIVANITSSTSSLSKTKSSKKTKTKPTRVTKSRFQRKKKKEKSRKSEKIETKNSYGHFNSSRGDHYQKKPHRGKNPKRRGVFIQSRL